MGHVIVIGAGLAGLSAACHLIGAGHRVTLCEREEVPGGRNGQLHRDGFTFDTGPTVLTMPELIDIPLRAIGTSVAEQLDLIRLDPAYRACFADGSQLMVRAGHEQMREEIARECGSADAGAFDDFVVWLKRLHHNEMPNFIDRNFNSPLDLLSRPRAALELLRLGGFGRLGPRIAARFRDERLHRLFSFQAMYAGLAPDQALALYAVITYMDSIEGVFFPRGGMRAVPEAMARALQDAGAELRLSTEIDELICEAGGRVRGVRTATGESLAADAVVCTLDLPVAHEKFLGGLRPPRAVRRGRYSPSAVVWHVGVEGTVDPGVAHHNIHFGQQWSQAFDDLLKGGRLMRDPSRMVTVHSKDDPGAAPEGCSTLYVLEPVPNLQVGRVDWHRETPAMRERLAQFLHQQGYPDTIRCEEIVTPLDWQAQGMAAGTPFALAHTFAQTGPFRPANVERRRPGLVFAGSSTVPGVGVPMVLISGGLAARRVEEMLR